MMVMKWHNGDVSLCWYDGYREGMLKAGALLTMMMVVVMVIATMMMAVMVIGMKMAVMGSLAGLSHEA